MENIENAQNSLLNEISSDFTDGGDFEQVQQQRQQNTLQSAEKVYAATAAKPSNLIDASQYGIDDVFGDQQPDNYFFGQNQTLVAPPPRAGYEQRWVLYEVGGKPNTKNIQKQRAKGYLPRRRSTVTTPLSIPTRAVDGGDAIMMIDGYVLCEIPVQKAEALRAMYQQQVNTQNQALRANLESTARGDNTPVNYDSKEVVQLGMRPRTVQVNP